MPGEKPRDPFSAKDAEEAAKLLSYFSARYSDLAKAMAARGVQSIKAGNLKSFRLAMAKVKSAVNRAYEAFDEQVLGPDARKKK
jgi:hypothetical protein